MQMLFRTLLALYLAHLLADFGFQTHRLLEYKRHARPAAYLVHGLIHYLFATVIAGFFVRGLILSLKTHLVIAGLTLLHLLIDRGKIHFAAKGWISDGARAYVFDQFLHFLTIGMAAWLLSPAIPGGELDALIQRFRAIPSKFLAVPVIYVGVIFGGGYLIRFLTRYLAEGLKAHSPEKTGEQLQNAGLYIGWLERFLVLTALLLQSPATVGLIMTAKAIARYPEFKSERFAEYFLIGTLLSISMALAGGAVLSRLLLGQARLP
jgi:hypothetical protein